mmetsp:Transcript_2690/g.7730  ORF Transcript_2690/g.7730 Transcript_2690/m.7730 type:complete len:634 (+) Transcript_2690:41-1942(+)
MWALRRLCVFATLSAPCAAAFECSTDMRLGQVGKSRSKGIALDDNTLRWCASQIPEVWPNVGQRMSSIRLFKAWDARWEEGGREKSWDGLVEYVSKAGAKVFVGTPLTCDEKADDQSWAWTKELMKKLRPRNVMGLAIGNELELLQFKGLEFVPDGCLNDLWERGYVWRKFQQYVAEFDAMGFDAIPVTSVFSGLGLAGDSFYEVPGRARVGSLLANATRVYGRRFAFTWNFYPYFDSSMRLDAGSTSECQGALGAASCWGPGCIVPSQLRHARTKMRALTGHGDSLLWIGETGWSSPVSSSLNTELSRCPAWSSKSTFERFYKGFLDWDLDIGEGEKGPDHAFWFTVRDSTTFGADEHFGLIAGCDQPKCKIASAGFQPFKYKLYIPPGKYACGGRLIFDNWVVGGKTTCQNKCEMDPNCYFYGIWPHSHDNMYWCRLTRACNLLDRKQFVVSTYRKISLPYTTVAPTTTKAPTTTSTTAAPTTQASVAVPGAGASASAAGGAGVSPAAAAQQAPRVPTSPTDTFDCQAGWSHWEEWWSMKKKVWCCEYKRVACQKPAVTAEYSRLRVQAAELPGRRMPGAAAAIAALAGTAAIAAAAISWRSSRSQRNLLLEDDPMLSHEQLAGAEPPLLE